MVQQAFLDNEEAVIKRLKTVYNKSLEDITDKAAKLQKEFEELESIYDNIEDEEEKKVLKSRMRSKVYQKQYQESLKKQVSGIIDKLHDEDYKTVSEYLEKCYDDGFIGTMYDLQGQGIPMCFPLDQESMVRAVQLDSKISEGLYNHLGENYSLLKKRITAEVSRGIASSMTYGQVAQQLAAKMTGIYKNPGGALAYSMRIARTEGHRIQCQATMDACYNAKDRGANIVKQWDATLDGRTRDSHSAVDGEWKELDEKFSNGLMFPGDPSGRAEEVIHCRCALLQKSRDSLKNGFTKMNNFTKQLETFESPEDYAEFKKAFFSKENKAYMNHVQSMEEKYKTKDFAKVLDKMDTREYNRYSKLIEQNPVFNKKELTSITNPISSKIQQMETFEQISEYMQEEYGIKMMPQVQELAFIPVKDAITGIEWTMQQFPETKGYLKKICVGKKGGVMYCTGNTISLTEACFTGEYYKGNHKFFTRTGVHESAHMLEGWLIDSTGTDRKGFAEMWNKHDVARGIVKESVEKLPLNVIEGKKGYEIAEMISPDASINSSETMAEAIADVWEKGEDASILSKEIFKTIKRKAK